MSEPAMFMKRVRNEMWQPVGLGKPQQEGVCREGLWKPVRAAFARAANRRTAEERGTSRSAATRAL